VIIRVPLAGWRIREIPDCASSPKTHKKPAELRTRLMEIRDAIDALYGIEEPKE
jgi:hypothetical protein